MNRQELKDRLDELNHILHDGDVGRFYSMEACEKMDAERRQIKQQLDAEMDRIKWRLYTSRGQGRYQVSFEGYSGRGSSKEESLLELRRSLADNPKLLKEFLELTT